MEHITYRILHEEWCAGASNPHEGETGRGIEVSGPEDAWTITVAESTICCALLLRMFEDAFAAFGDIPWFFSALADGVTSLEDVRIALDVEGAEDVTPRTSPYDTTPSR